MAEILFGVLKAIHVLFAVMWIGGAIFLNAVVVPSVGQAGPPATGMVMARLVPRSTRYFIHIGAITIVTGILAFVSWPTLDPASLSSVGVSPWGTLTLAGAAVAVVMYLEGLFVVKPTLEKLLEVGGKLAKSQGPPPEELKGQLAALQAKMKVASISNVALGILAVVLMVATNWVVHT